MKSNIEISIIIPIFNEQESIKFLVAQILQVMKSSNEKFELIVVDDGSKDNSVIELKELSKEVKELTCIVLRKNYGQTAAMAAGFDKSQGKIIVTLDGDLQNDPQDIPLLIKKIRDGYDLVSGWRFKRKDSEFSRKLPSKIANKLIAKVTGVHLHDYGCSLKAYKKEVLSDIRPYGELHRFLPVLANIEGAKIAEIKVNHRPRKYGNSKYGIDRTFRVLMDLLTVWFMNSFLTRPMYVFGFGGLLAISGSIVSSFYLLFLKVLGEDIGDRPLLTFSLVLGVAGVQLFCFGLLSELQIRTYHESQGRPIYRIRNTFKGLDTF
tara:strand:+ start:319 stop:1281 length:963 start_codon:yes stop_codon:yes gene_type:complete